MSTFSDEFDFIIAYFLFSKLFKICVIWWMVVRVVGVEGILKKCPGKYLIYVYIVVITYFLYIIIFYSMSPRPDVAFFVSRKYVIFLCIHCLCIDSKNIICLDNISYGCYRVERNVEETSQKCPKIWNIYLYNSDYLFSVHYFFFVLVRGLMYKKSSWSENKWSRPYKNQTF